MGEPLLHPLLPQFIMMAREKGFKTVLTSNGTLLHRCMELLDTLPDKAKYVEEVMQIVEQYVPKPWRERPDGFRLSDNLYLEFDRKFQWPDAGKERVGEDGQKAQLYCKALTKQIGILSDGSLMPCCPDHDGDVILGNLFRQSLEEILSSPHALAMTEAFKHHAASEKLCQNCESALARNSFRGKARS